MLPVQLNAAIVLSSFHPGGTEYQTIELLQRLDPTRWRVHVACFHDEGAWRDRVHGAAASVREFPLISFRHPDTLRQMRRFAAWCRQQQMAVVHAADLYANIFALPAAAWARVPVRIGSRRELNPDKSLGQIALQRAAYACAHSVLANSQAAAARLQQERVPAHRIAVIPNGLDLTRFTGVTPQRRGHTVIVVANLRREKGHDTLLRAAQRMLARHPETRFRLVGDGPQRAAITQQAQALGIAHAVDLLGYRADVVDLLASADISVVPSTSEAFPNAAVEAMAAGVPVVASAVGGLLELVHHEQNGLLVPPSDDVALASAMSHLLADSRLRTRLGATARADVFARYSFDRMVGSVNTLYLTELHRRRSTQAATVVAS